MSARYYELLLHLAEYVFFSFPANCRPRKLLVWMHAAPLIAPPALMTRLFERFGIVETSAIRLLIRCLPLLICVGSLSS